MVRVAATLIVMTLSDIFKHGNKPSGRIKSDCQPSSKIGVLPFNQ